MYKGLRLFALVFFFLFIIFVWVDSGFCEEFLHISLKDVVSLALKQNLDIKVSKLDPLIAKALVKVAKGEFDPVPYIELSGDKTKSRAATTLDGAEISVRENRKWNFGWKHRLPTGTSYELSMENRKYDTNSAFARSAFGINPSYRSDVVLSVTQPILKGFGVSYNEGEIEINLAGLRSASLSLKEKMSNVVSQVQKTYWELCYAYAALDAAKASCDWAKNLLKENHVKFESGEIPSVDVLEAEAEVAQREEDVITAKQRVDDLISDLRHIINISDRVSIIPSDVPIFVSKYISLPELVKTALHHRYDYLRAKEDLHAKGITCDIAENETLPKLDIIGSLGINGLGDTYENDMDRLGSFDYYNWSIGLRFEIPIGNRVAKGTLQKARLEKEKALLELKNMENAICLEVEKAYRKVMACKERVKAAKLTKQLADKKLKMEEKRYKVGLSTTHKLLQFQEDCAEAQSNNVKALVDYNIALVELKEKTGTVLQELPSAP